MKKLVVGAVVGSFAVACGPSLSTAVATNDVQSLEKILAGGGDPNSLGADEQPVLCTAVRKGDVKVVDVLVRGGAKTDVDCGNDKPIEIAARRHDAATLAYLLEQGANALARGKKDKGSIPTIVAMTGKPDKRAVIALYLDHVEKKHGKEKAEQIADGRKTGKTGTYADREDPDAMGVAAYNCDVDMVRALVARGADPKALRGTYGGEDRELRGFHHSTAWPLTFLARAGAEMGRDPHKCKDTIDAAVEMGVDANVDAGGLTWKDARAEWRKAVKEHEADEREWQRIKAESDADHERRSAEASRQNFARFQQIMEDTARPNPNNPAEDKSFQERMKRQASGQPATSSGSGSITVTESSPAAPSTPPTSPDPTPSASAEPLKAPPMKPVAGDCQLVKARPRLFGSWSEDREKAEKSMRAQANIPCQGGAYTLENLECVENRYPKVEMVGGKPKLGADRVTYQCRATAVCEKPREVCKVKDAAVTKQ
jgi:hypothetical protein